MSAIKLGDFITLQRGTTYKGQLLGQEGAVLIGLASIQREGGFRDDKLETYGGECPEKISLRAGDLYVSLKDITNDGHLLGAVARIPEKIKLGRLTQDTVKLVFLKDEFPRNYIYWLLRTPQCRNYCRSLQTGTTNLGLGREDFLSFQVPPLTDFSSSIVESLEAIEKKIENLRRQNETLEQIAQTLFKHWFIDFEFPFDFAQGKPNADGKPYKSSGGAIVASELGDIPVGWTIKPLDEIAEFLNGLALQKYPPENADDFLPVIKIRELRTGVNDGSDRASVNIPKKYVIDNGDIIFSWSGSLDVVIWNFGKGALNQHLFKVDSDKYPKWFYYYWTLNHLQSFQHIAKSKATTMGHIQRKHLTEALCSVPNSNFLEKASKVFSPMLQKIVNNAQQIQTLTKTRDSLLPKLMSGQLRVKE
jgi:type I restriction enzyme S subunit